MYQVHTNSLPVAAQVVIDDDMSKLVFGSFFGPQNFNLHLVPPWHAMAIIFSPRL